MNNDYSNLTIASVFTLSDNSPFSSFYPLFVRQTLNKCLPNVDFINDHTTPNELEHFHELLPIFKASSDENPLNISFSMLSKFRPNAFDFFFKMINQWLLVNKHLNVAMVYAIDFKLPKLGETVYTLCQLAVQVENQVDLDQIYLNLPILETEIRLGVKFDYYAHRILEIKGLSADAKTAMIQEYLVFLIKRKPNYFDYDLLTEMQHILVICGDDFKATRDCRLLRRIIGIHYLFRKALQEAIKKLPEKRHLSLKLFRTYLHDKSEKKPILGVLVGVNFLKEKEFFEKKHLISAIQNYVPSAQIVEHSFLSNRRENEQICTLYFELEKGEGKEFTSDEISILRKELPYDLKDRIAHLMHPVFMPRNEEEIMRNILSLGSQIRFQRDIPQVIITFDEQSHSSLFFTIILVRVVLPGEPSIQDLFRKQDTFLEYIHDRCKTIGLLRNKHSKEATVFRVKVLKQKQFLRRDHSIDLNKARQTVVMELLNIIGEFRDFNGGMISKQNELLSEVRALLYAGNHKYTDLLLENFFYSITPVIMRTVLEGEVVHKLFVMQLQAMDRNNLEEKNYETSISRESSFVFALIESENEGVKEEISRSVTKSHLHSSELANSYLQLNGIHYIGYIYRSDDPIKQQQFVENLQSALKKWENKKVEALAFSALFVTAQSPPKESFSIID